MPLPISHSTSVTLLLATASDIPVLAEVHVLAGARDEAFQLRFDFDSEKIRTAISESMDDLIGKEGSKVVKAVDAQTGEVVGVVGMSVCENEAKATTILDGALRKEEKEGEKQGDPEDKQSTLPESSKALAKHKRTREHDELATYLRNNEVSKYVEINTLVVRPDCWRRGVGSALMRWCNEKADEEGLVSWVTSTPAGARSYLANGFEEVGRLDVKVDEWAVGEQIVKVKRLVEGNGGNAMDMYRYRYLARAAKGDAVD